MNSGELEGTLRKLAAEFRGEMGLVVRGYRRPLGENVTAEVDIEITPETVMPSCSLIKVPILWTLLEEVDAGRLDLSQEMALREEEKAGSRGILKELHAGLRPSIRDLAILMIVLSDNTATNMLIGRLGFDRINETCRALELTSTVLVRKMMDARAMQAGLENFTCARDCARLLELMVRRQRLLPISHDLLLDIMLRQQLNDLLPFLMPQGTRLAHKTGELPGYRHDMGLLLLDSWVVSISAMTHWHERLRDSTLLLNEVGRVVHQAFASDES